MKTIYTILYDDDAEDDNINYIVLYTTKPHPLLGVALSNGVFSVDGLGGDEDASI